MPPLRISRVPRAADRGRWAPRLRHWWKGSLGGAQERQGGQAHLAGAGYCQDRSAETGKAVCRRRNHEAPGGIVSRRDESSAIQESASAASPQRPALLRSSEHLHDPARLARVFPKVVNRSGESHGMAQVVAEIV